MAAVFRPLQLGSVGARPRRTRLRLSDVQLFPMLPFVKASGNAVLDALHEAQGRHPIRAVWDPILRLPTKLVEYVSAVCVDAEPETRQEAVLLLKRYVWGDVCGGGSSGGGSTAQQRPPPQVVALTCAHLATKHWQQHRPQCGEGGRYGISEQQLHSLSRNSYTRQNFIDAEATILRTLGCIVHWEGTLLAEWVGVVLVLAGPLLAEAGDADAVRAVATHIMDVLAFQDALMAKYLPSELAAATIHAAVMFCTKRFCRYAFTLRVGHLCRVPEDHMVQLSEQILEAAVGERRAELILEGSGLTSEDSDLSGRPMGGA